MWKVVKEEREKDFCVLLENIVKEKISYRVKGAGWMSVSEGRMNVVQELTQDDREE